MVREPMKVIFISGPFRSTNPDGTNDSWETHMNVTVAMRLGLAVARMGAMPFIPHANSFCFDSARGVSSQLWLDGDIEILSRCDAMLCTYDWERSAGAIGEMAFAKEHNIPVFFNEGDLKTWLLRG